MPNTSLALEITERRIRMALYRAVGAKTEIVRLVSADVSPEDPESLKNALRSLIEPSMQASSAILLIPRHLVLAKIMKFPSTDPEELRDILSISLLRQFPYEEDDTVGGYRVIREENDGHSSVFMAVAHKSMVLDMCRTAESCGLTIERAMLGAESLCLWFSENFPDTRSKNILLINIGDDSMDVEVLEKGKQMFSRGIALSPGAGWLDEVSVSISGYSKVSTEKIEAIYLCGRPGDAELLEPLAQSIELPLVTVDIFAHAGVEASENVRRDPPFASLLGLCHYAQQMQIDLIPAEMREVGRFKLIRRALAMSLLWISLMFFFVFGMLFKGGCDRQAAQSRLSAELKKAQPLAAEVQKMRGLLDEAFKNATAKPKVADIFAEVQRKTPDHVTLEFMDYEDHKRMLLRGNVSSLSQVSEYAQLLEGSDWFSSVRVLNAKQRGEGATAVVDFEIETDISSEVAPKRARASSETLFIDASQYDEVRSAYERVLKNPAMSSAGTSAAFERLETTGRLSSAQIINVKPRSSRGEEGSRRLLYDATIKADPRGILRFVYEMESADPIFHIRRFTISALPSEGGNASLLQCTLIIDQLSTS